MKKVYIKVCVNLQNMQETALFSGQIYTADKNFTRPLVATVATNSKSVIEYAWIYEGNSRYFEILGDS